MTQAKLTCAPENAAKFQDWLATRGGLAVWESADFSDPDFSLTTPALTDGRPTASPHWKVANVPARVITDPAEVEVVTPRVVTRFHVGTRMGGNGLSVKVSDGGSRRIRRELERAGPGSWYAFDYESHDNCVILAPDKAVPLAEFVPL